MTLGEGKNKVYMLLDEHSAGGVVEHDEDIEKKMTAFFDTAQKLLSQVKKLLRAKTIRPEPGRSEYAMPADFRSVYRVWRDGKRAERAYHWRRGRLVIPAGDNAESILVEYFAFPATIPADAPDSYEFELAPDACECMPYFVAAQQLLPDLVMDYGAMLAMFERMVALLDKSVAGEDAHVRQALYR